LSLGCEPWSVLKISGCPNFEIASWSASTQKSAVSVFESLKLSTFRLATSRIATRYMKPCAIGRYVISLAHTWFGRSIEIPERR
jgi:hypothetical protein